VLLLKVFWKCTWKVMMTMKKSRRNVTGDESQWKTSQQLYYGNGRYSRPPARYTEASLVKNWKS
jgi:DNA topoisomerase IA